MKVCCFVHESDCLKVSESVYNCVRDNNRLFFKPSNLAAVELAIGLANLNYDVEIFDTFERLPFEEWDSDPDAPRIYVRCLSAYVNGHLHGMWIDANQEVEEIQAAINYMLSWSPMVYLEACVREASRREEWAIHDYENFEGISIDEYESLDRVSTLANNLVEYGEPYAAYVSYYGDESASDFEENYHGCYEDEEDFAYSLYDDMGLIQQIEKLGLQSLYIDFKAIARDLFIDSYFSVQPSYQKCFVFSR